VWSVVKDGAHEEQALPREDGSEEGGATASSMPEEAKIGQKTGNALGTVSVRLKLSWIARHFPFRKRKRKEEEVNNTQ